MFIIAFHRNDNDKKLVWAVAFKLRGKLRKGFVLIIEKKKKKSIGSHSSIGGNQNRTCDCGDDFVNVTGQRVGEEILCMCICIPVRACLCVFMCARVHLFSFSFINHIPAQSSMLPPATLVAMSLFGPGARDPGTTDITLWIDTIFFVIFSNRPHSRSNCFRNKDQLRGLHPLKLLKVSFGTGRMKMKKRLNVAFSLYQRGQSMKKTTCDIGYIKRNTILIHPHTQKCVCACVSVCVYEVDV